MAPVPGVLPRLLAGAVWLAGAWLGQADVQVDVLDEATATFAVQVAGQTWLHSAPLRLFVNGRWHYAGGPNATLLPKGAARFDSQDELGIFSCVRLEWAVAGESVVLFTTVKTYDDGNFAVFEQELPFGAAGTNASNPTLPQSPNLDTGAYPPVVAFPSFDGQAALLPELGFGIWHGCMSGFQSGAGVTAHLQGLSSNGPVALFDEQYNTLVVSPMDNFKSAVHTYSEETGAWETGISSELESLPAQFRHRTLLVAGRGVTATMDAWGSTLRRVYGTQRLSDEDKVVNYLSYWTDNGAYYYGDAWGEAGGGGANCNEAAMRSVATGLDEQGLLEAVGIWQLDDWWYPGHTAQWVHCVQNWTLAPPAFNSSLRELAESLGKPWLLYVPFFCPENAYTGQVRFINSTPGPAQFAQPHPDDAAQFYRALFDYGVRSGMQSFEHDFLNFNLLAMPHFRKTFGSSERWLQAINTAALEQRLPVQLCMSLPSDLMESVRMDSATNYRASDDYAGSDNWDIGGSSILAFALALRPSKDNFWTHRPQSAIDTGRPWGPHDNPGSNCELNIIIATLSTGPVGIADKAGDTNRTLVLRAVRPDGLIIQPDRPATYVDAMLAPEAWSSPRPKPEGAVWCTSSTVSEYTWHYALSVDLRKTWQLSQRDFYPAMRAASGWVVRRWHRGHAPNPCADGAAALTFGCLLAAVHSEVDMPVIQNDRPIMVQNDTHVFDLFQLAPIAPNGWVLLGDTSRYVAGSGKRFLSLDFSTSGLRAQVTGAPNEQIALTALRPRAAGGGAAVEWDVVVKQVVFPSAEPVIVDFGGETVVHM